ncbi:MAG: 4-hydroxy-tetrahydrodipicolinate reductase [Clostridia bacterium]|nr:4-hydroxy-tetrahydrodipicolinate reductase [Clostridia bacterium]
MNILLNGICGHMGAEVAALCRAGYRGATLIYGIDPTAQNMTVDGTVVYHTLAELPTAEKVDCIIDFSHHSCVESLLDFAIEHNIPTVVATTGHTDAELCAIYSAAREIPVFFSANMSLGVALLVELARTAALAMPEAEIEIIEKHHNRKIDAPSGTALMIADAICDVRPDAYTNLARHGHGKRPPNEIGIHAIRMGNIVGEHEVIVGTQNQTITLKHEAHSRALFAEGAIAAAAFLVGKPSGLYDMKSLVSGESLADRATIF